VRIEINAGGLGRFLDGVSLFSNSANSNSASNRLIRTLNGVVTRTGNVTGGVGGLGDARQSIQRRITTEESRQAAIRTVWQRTNTFIDTARDVDNRVAGMVAASMEQFYQTNPWLRPPVPTTRLQRFFGNVRETASIVWNGVVNFVREHWKVIVAVVAVIAIVALIVLTGGAAIPFLLKAAVIAGKALAKGVVIVGKAMVKGAVAAGKGVAQFAINAAIGIGKGIMWVGGKAFAGAKFVGGKLLSFGKALNSSKVMAFSQKVKKSTIGKISNIVNIANLPVYFGNRFELWNEKTIFDFAKRINPDCVVINFVVGGTNLFFGVTSILTLPAGISQLSSNIARANRLHSLATAFNSVQSQVTAATTMTLNSGGIIFKLYKDGGSLLSYLESLMTIRLPNRPLVSLSE